MVMVPPSEDVVFATRFGLQWTCHGGSIRRPWLRPKRSMSPKAISNGDVIHVTAETALGAGRSGPAHGARPSRKSHGLGRAREAPRSTIACSARRVIAARRFDVRARRPALFAALP